MRARFATVLVLLAALGLVPTAASAAPFPETIPLPAGFAPEGIESGRGTTFFVGSLEGGAVYRGDLRTGDGSVLVPAQGTVAVGMFYETRRDRLWVAGGPTGEVRVYDASSGALLQTYTFPDAGFLNDLTIARGTVYVTDSQNQELAVVPLGRAGALPDPSAARTLPLSGDLQYVEGFNANGVVAAEGGRWLVLVQSATGLLFRVDPVTGVTTRIELAGGDVRNGDGLELRGHTLYVVQNQLEQVAVVRLGPALRSGSVEATITQEDAEGELDVPTTVTAAAGRLWTVNARFGVEPTPTTAYDVVQLPLRPGR